MDGFSDPDLGLGVQESTQTDFHCPRMTLRCVINCWHKETTISRLLKGPIRISSALRGSEKLYQYRLRLFLRKRAGRSGMVHGSFVSGVAIHYTSIRLLHDIIQFLDLVLSSLVPPEGFNTNFEGPLLFNRPEIVKAWGEEFRKTVDLYLQPCRHSTAFSIK